MWPRSLASRLDSGSSNRKTLGSRTMARPIATRWRWPPDSSLGLRASRWPMFSTLAAAATLLSISALGRPARRKANDMLVPTSMCGYSA